MLDIKHNSSDQMPRRFDSVDELKQFLRTEIPKRARPIVERYIDDRISAFMKELKTTVPQITGDICRELEAKLTLTVIFSQQDSSLASTATVAPQILNNLAKYGHGSRENTTIPRAAASQKAVAAEVFGLDTQLGLKTAELSEFLTNLSDDPMWDDMLNGVALETANAVLNQHDPDAQNHGLEPTDYWTSASAGSVDSGHGTLSSDTAVSYTSSKVPLYGHEY